jgi:hypothetical protein
MSENKQDVLARAYAKLSALRKNIDQMADYRSKITETYVREFHYVLDSLESLAIDITEFRVPDSEVKPLITGSSLEGGKRYSDDKYVDKSFILTKIDAILGYFEIITADKPRRIGFHTPENK